MANTTIIDLIPCDGRKSFWDKAKVMRNNSTGAEVLISYGTPILRRDPSGRLARLWGGWSATTGRHIRSFCGMGKAAFVAMPVGE